MLPYKIVYKFVKKFYVSKITLNNRIPFKYLMQFPLYSGLKFKKKKKKNYNF